MYFTSIIVCFFFFFQAEDGIRDLVRSRGLGDVYKRQLSIPENFPMVEYLEHLFEFTSLESCGKCFPCRIGSTRGKEMIQGARLNGKKMDRALFNDLLETMEIGSLCALGGGGLLKTSDAPDERSSAELGGRRNQ